MLPAKYIIPSAGPAREALRKKGQFWTPDWVAEAMTSYVLVEPETKLFDPAVGAGAFFRAAQRVAQEKGLSVHLSGMDLDPTVFAQALEFGLQPHDYRGVVIGDFLAQSTFSALPAIVANPPYLRHHRLPQEQKESLRRMTASITGMTIDGRAGLHVYFLIYALSLLAPNGRLAFIVPADICEGTFAPKLWRWITHTFSLESVVTFLPQASPFPQIDTNPLIFFIQKKPPQATFDWLVCQTAATPLLRYWVENKTLPEDQSDLIVQERSLEEGIATGLSRPPQQKKATAVLGDYLQVMRGIATGDNDFFFLTKERMEELWLDPAYFVRAIGRTRDVQTSEITEKTLDLLQEKGRPTYLLALGNENVAALPQPLQAYLQRGEEAGLPHRPLLSQRKPWFKMEKRAVPPLLFAYLGRRNVRFIKNQAEIVPLTGFLCLYPRRSEPDFLDELWQLLNHPQTIENLALIGKSYGDGAIKVEPRALERLPLPALPSLESLHFSQAALAL